MPPNRTNQTSFPMTIQRTELFVPLTTAPPAGESREFRIQVIPDGERGQFTALEDDAGRRQLASAGVGRSAPGSGNGSSPQAGTIQPVSRPFLGKKNCEPQVMLQRDGERITSIRIQCSCGPVMDLACDYGAVEELKS